MHPSRASGPGPGLVARAGAGGAAGAAVWALVGLTTVSVISRFVMEFRRLGTGEDPVRVIDSGLWGLLAILFGLVGALIVSRRAANLIGWLLLVPPLTGGAVALTTTYLERLVGPPVAMEPLLFLALVLDTTGWVLVIFPVLLLAQLFPTGRALPGAWRLVPAITLAMAATFFVFVALGEEFTPLSIDVGWTVGNPIGVFSREDFPLTVWLVLLVGVSLGSAVSLVARYRGGTPVERVQMRWLLFACAAFVSVYVTLLVLNAGAQEGMWPLLYVVSLPLSIALVPIAIAAAVLRYRLWDIDIVIRRTLVYAPLTAIMAGVFSASMGLTQRVFGSLAGGTSEATGVLTTIIVVAAFDPIKRSLTRFVDARFKEGRDARQRWHDYGAALQVFLDLHDPPTIARHLLDEALAAFDARGGRVSIVDLEGRTAAYASGAQDAAAVELPLEHRGTLVGVLQLAARWNGRPYDAHDLDLLRAQASAVARTIWLAQRDVSGRDGAAPAPSLLQAERA